MNPESAVTQPTEEPVREALDLQAEQQRRKARVMAIGLALIVLSTLLCAGINAWSILRIGGGMPSLVVEIAHSLPPSEPPTTYALVMDWSPMTGRSAPVRPTLRLQGGMEIPAEGPGLLADVRNFGRQTLSLHIPPGVTPGMHKGALVLIRRSGAEDLPLQSLVPVELQIAPWWQHWWLTAVWILLLLVAYASIYLLCVLTLRRPSGFLRVEGGPHMGTKRLSLRMPWIGHLLPWRRPYLPLSHLQGLGFRTRAQLCFLLKDSPHLQGAETGRFRHCPKELHLDGEALLEELPFTAPFTPMAGRVFYHAPGEDPNPVTFWFTPH